MPDWRIRVNGDAAVTVESDPRIDPVINEWAVTLADTVRSARHPGVRDVVPSYSAVTVYFNPLHTDLDRLWAALEDAAAAPVAVARAPREVVVPVRYGGGAGPDLDEVAAYAGCSPDEVVRRHTAPQYRVYMVGFLPGFPYLGTVDARIAMPRRSSPRLAVPAASVGIAGTQTGIYPTTAPGGWRLIGLAAVDPFDAGREPPSLFRPGDTVRFRAMSTETGR
jgi:inhibitor of KinA